MKRTGQKNMFLPFFPRWQVLLLLSQTCGNQNAKNHKLFCFVHDEVS